MSIDDVLRPIAELSAMSTRGRLRTAARCRMLSTATTATATAIAARIRYCSDPSFLSRCVGSSGEVARILAQANAARNPTA
jgi:hypothetical protein